MKEFKVLYGQNIHDVIISYCGNLDNISAILEDNDLGYSDDIQTGDIIRIREDFLSDTYNITTSFDNSTFTFVTPTLSGETIENPEPVEKLQSEYLEVKIEFGVSIYDIITQHLQNKEKMFEFLSLNNLELDSELRTGDIVHFKKEWLSFKNSFFRSQNKRVNNQNWNVPVPASEKAIIDHNGSEFTDQNGNILIYN